MDSVCTQQAQGLHPWAFLIYAFKNLRKLTFTLRTPRTLRAIAEVARTARHPERLHNLMALIEDGLGYALYQAVATAKADLSRADSTVLRFRHKGFAMERSITRGEFESWIEGDLTRLAATVDQVLAEAAMQPEAIDRVFLTGGTAFVPAVRRLFEQRFGREKLVGGGEFVSVDAEGGTESFLDGSIVLVRASSPDC